MKYQSKRQEKHKDLFLERVQIALKLGWTQNEMGFWRNPKPPHYGYDTKGMIELLKVRGEIKSNSALASKKGGRYEQHDKNKL